MTGVIAGLAQVLVPTHMLALVALGLLAGQNAAHLPPMTLVALAFGLFAGSCLIASAVADTPAALTLLALSACCGLAVAAGWAAPAPVRHGLALTTGIALALNSPPQAIAIPPAIAAQAVTGLAALAAVALIARIVSRAARPWQRVGVRIAGSWVTASAILALALRLAR